MSSPIAPSGTDLRTKLGLIGIVAVLVVSVFWYFWSGVLDNRNRAAAEHEVIQVVRASHDPHLTTATDGSILSEAYATCPPLEPPKDRSVPAIDDGSGLTSDRFGSQNPTHISEATVRWRELLARAAINADLCKHRGG